MTGERLVSAPSCRYSGGRRTRKIAPKGTLPARGSNGEVGWEPVVPDLPGPNVRMLESGRSLPEARTPRRRAYFSAAAGRPKGRRISSSVRSWRLLGAEDHRMDVAAWLQGLGLERYVPAFCDNEIDWEVLPRARSERPGTCPTWRRGEPSAFTVFRHTTPRTARRSSTPSGSNVSGAVRAAFSASRPCGCRGFVRDLPGMTGPSAYPTLGRRGHDRPGISRANPPHPVAWLPR
jgi:hypothetical protein